MSAQQTLGKVAVVDTASLILAGQSVGIPLISARGLYTILEQEVGEEKKFYGRPIMTLAPALSSPDNRLRGAFEEAGFELAFPKRSHEEDDAYIIEEINKVDPTRVSEIVLVGADHCYIIPLWRKLKEIEAVQGKRETPRVWWLTSELIEKNGTSCVGKMLRKCFEAKMFGLAELANFRAQLTFKPISHRSKKH